MSFSGKGEFPLLEELSGFRSDYEGTRGGEPTSSKVIPQIPPFVLQLFWSPLSQ